jgi:hypothetical protein
MLPDFERLGGGGSTRYTPTDMSRNVLGSQTWDRQRHRSSRGHRRRVKSRVDLQF